MIRVEILRGDFAGRSFEIARDSVHIGRAEGNDILLTDEWVSSDHARLVVEGDGITLQDLRSTNGTFIVRGTTRIRVEPGPGLLLDATDHIELGMGESVVELSAAVEDKDETRVVSLRRLEEVKGGVSVDKFAEKVRQLYDAQTKINTPADLDEVLLNISDSILELLPKATHATVILRDDDDDPKGGVSNYVPVLTRLRGKESAKGPIPITRSVYKKVIIERAAVLAADAQTEVGKSDSLMGASIQSTMGVPLWKGDEILGVLQVDNRELTGMFTSNDLDLLLVIAANASLAVANARLVRRLRVAEERLKKENAFLKGREETRRTGKSSQSNSGAHEIVGDSQVMRDLLAQLDKVVDTKVGVLIEGETGTGKELIAAAVHYRSKRRDKLFVGQNCAALPETLLDSELFGHRKGSFTGAHEDKKGLFELADGGTLFLDEITETPMSLQSKLLRVLQEGEIRAVGATHEKKVDVRIVAATNRNLAQEVAAGRFRQDLYYRLTGFPVRVPPLRERREDVPILGNYFLKRFTAEMSKPVSGFAQQTSELLQSYDWPGNVRELQNEVQRLVIQVDPGGFITPDLLSPHIRQIEGVVERAKPTKGTLKEMMDQVERWLLIEALRSHDNNKTACAKSLGITREGLHKKLRAYGL